jgi:aminoacrylate hydrolase
MPTIETQGIVQSYELRGQPKNPPVLLIGGLPGRGADWGPQIARFASKYLVITVDQRGTGASTHAQQGYTTKQLAADTAAVVEHLDLGPVDVVGASTGAAIGQYMALDHPQTVRSLTLAGAFAHFDVYARRSSDVRRRIVVESDRELRYACYAWMLFSPRYSREHPEKVQEWIDGALSASEDPADRDIAVKRLDMIAAHNTVSRLKEIRQPTLIVCGDLDVATPLTHSEELAAGIPDSELVVLRDAGHLIEFEKEEEFFETISRFIDRHRR